MVAGLSIILIMRIIKYQEYILSGGDVGEAEYDNQGRLVTWTYTDVDDNPVGNPSIGVANFVYNQDNSVVQTWSR